MNPLAQLIKKQYPYMDVENKALQEALPVDEPTRMKHIEFEVPAVILGGEAWWCDEKTAQHPKHFNDMARMYVKNAIEIRYILYVHEISPGIKDTWVDIFCHIDTGRWVYLRVDDGCVQEMQRYRVTERSGND